MKKIYGADASKEITPVAVRDAIIRCFKEAHKDVFSEMRELFTYP